ncbi:lipocalin family protein [Bosea sp. ANAM02]|uniref:lipocalin family protein n=1 Tax=Bosea sp. ANAM02 TaxID=2020412 RepID=UPI0018D99DDB|nr:lipocalin family protein [Bosea sp. ANAM02]
MSALVIGSSLAPRPLIHWENQPVGNSNVPQPAKPVELKRYLGMWYEQARYEAGFQKGCDAVTAEYAQKPDGTVSVVNSCHQGGVTGPLKTAEATARVVDDSNGSKLKVTIFWPIEGTNGCWIARQTILVHRRRALRSISLDIDPQPEAQFGSVCGSGGAGEGAWLRHRYAEAYSATRVSSGDSGGCHRLVARRS